MKKILMLLDHEFPPDIRVENEIEALSQAGHELHLACFTMKGKALRERSGNLMIHRRPIGKFIYKSSVGALKFPFYFNFWRSFLRSLFNEDSFDAVHVHDLPLARVGYEFAEKHNIPLVLDLHENWPALLQIATHTNTPLGKLLSSTRQWRNYELEYCKKADHIIVVVDEAKERLSNLGIDRDKISVVSNTLNIPHFKLPEATPDPDYFTLLYAGGINKHRGLQYAIQGLKYLANLPKPVRLWILGSGSYEPNLKKLAKESIVSDSVHFMGWKDFNEMQVYFGKADVCLIPHVKSEHTDTTIPHKIFQYMYAGKPFVASDCKPIMRIAKDSQCGLTYSWDNPEAWADCIRKLAENPDMFQQLANNGKREVAEKYSWEKDAETLISIYA